MVSDIVSRFNVESELEKALQNDGFSLFLQPKIIEGATGRHFEVLLRLNHPERGIVGPGSFIDVAETTGLIVPIGAWVLEQACKMLAQNQDLHLAVNVSVRQFLRERFVTDLADLLARYPFEPERLTLEMTESLMIVNFDLALSQLKRSVTSKSGFRSTILAPATLRSSTSNSFPGRVEDRQDLHCRRPA
nr:EAL domain-containing protein [Marinicella sp. W31]MDC2875982.1 EAL domain-containing protein [Marinicella sp. W31]